jgi:hypothetical protein
MPPSYWANALSAATHLLNRLPTKTLNMTTPFFALNGTIPSYHELRAFGCTCYPNLSATNPPSYWANALSAATHLLNRLPTKTLNMTTPFFALNGTIPSYHELRAFGCTCYPNLSATNPPPPIRLLHASARTTHGSTATNSTSCHTPPPPARPQVPPLASTTPVLPQVAPTTPPMLPLAGHPASPLAPPTYFRKLSVIHTYSRRPP